MLSKARALGTRAATFLAGLRGARRAIAAVILGAVSVLAFAPVHAWSVLFFTFGGLVWLLDGCNAQHARLTERLKAAGGIGQRGVSPVDPDVPPGARGAGQNRVRRTHVDQ